MGKRSGSGGEYLVSLRGLMCFGVSPSRFTRIYPCPSVHRISPRAGTHFHFVPMQELRYTTFTQMVSARLPSKGEEKRRGRTRW